jgi:hypothetical protein
METAEHRNRDDFAGVVLVHRAIRDSLPDTLRGNRGESFGGEGGFLPEPRVAVGHLAYTDDKLIGVARPP